MPNGKTVSDNPDGQSDKEGGGGDELEDRMEERDEKAANTVVSPMGRTLYCEKNDEERKKYVDKFVKKLAYDGFGTAYKIMVLVSESIELMKCDMRVDGSEAGNEPSSEGEDSEGEYCIHLTVHKNWFIYCPGAHQCWKQSTTLFAVCSECNSEDCFTPVSEQLFK